MRSPQGEWPSRIADLSSFQKAVRTRSPVTGSIMIRPGSKDPTFAMYVPVIDGERVLFVIGAVVSPSAIRQSLRDQQLPEHWTSVVFDGARNVVAGSAEIYPPGASAGPILESADAKAPHGWLKGLNRYGVPTYAAYAQSPTSGWGVAIKVPAAIVEAPAQRAMIALLGGGALALGLAIAGVFVVGRRIEQPLRAISSAAESLGRGGVPSIDRVRIAELDRMADALELAARERRRLDDELRAAVASLQHAVRLRDDVLAVVTHDLRNPLTTVLFAAGLLRQTASDELASSAPRIASSIERAGSRMNRLLGDLLDYGAIETGRLRLNFEEHEPRAIVDEVVESFGAAAVKKGIELKKLASATRPIRCDQERIQQALGNLVGNAIAFTPEGGTVLVGLTSDDNEARFLVRDKDNTLRAVFIDTGEGKWKAGVRRLRADGGSEAPMDEGHIRASLATMGAADHFDETFSIEQEPRR